MEINSALASKFYGSLKGVMRPPVAPTTAPERPSAAETLRETAASFAETLRRGEETAKAGMVGRADPQSVVTALSSAELAVQSAVSVRDKVVEAYQEILRMPV